MATHDEKPQRGDLPDAAIEKAMAQLRGPYGQHVQALLEQINGKVVARTSSGWSGYCLEFTDQSWVICYLAGSSLDWRTGIGALTQEDRNLMQNPNAGNARAPLTSDRPYATEVCDIDTEVAQTIGKSVTGMAVGENSFNLCFPEDYELDATIVPDRSGVLGLRVFWEQW